MKAWAFTLGLLIAATTIGCKSEEVAICERLDECNLLVATSIDECSEDSEDIDDTEECLDCVEDRDCDEILPECAEACTD